VTQQPGGSGPDLIGEFQRWLIRSSARGVGKQVTGQIRSAFGRNQPTRDVWESATADPTPDEAPECAWCPLCRAARVLRESKPGRDTRVTAVSDALGMVVQDAFNVLDAALATTGRPAGGDGQRPGTAGQADKVKGGTAGRGTAGQADKAKGGTAGRGRAEQAARAGNGAARQGTAGHGAGAKAGQAGHGPADGRGSARRKPGGGPAAGHGPDGAHDTAGPGQGEEPAPEPPVGSPHEPDDRG
jgi:hypothetical protein